MINTAATDPRWEELQEYTVRNRLTGYERRILWDWIRSGHGVYNTAGPGYLSRPAWSQTNPTDAHGPDWVLTEDGKGIARDVKDPYREPYCVHGDSSPEQDTMNNVRRTSPELIGSRSRRLERELFHLWEFVWQEGVGDEAREFVDERKGDETPFEW
ncbi:MAG: hypothetical protein Q4A32_11370 [Lachnospiraceae bacterium]|nr:hypothetical protein [Lachnospiraceae bacterium]